MSQPTIPTVCPQPEPARPGEALAEMKAELERGLERAISAAVRDFSERSGVQVAGIEVGFLEWQHLSDVQPQSLVRFVKAHLSI
jgi:hypothetical protein